MLFVVCRSSCSVDECCTMSLKWTLRLRWTYWSYLRYTLLIRSHSFGIWLYRFKCFFMLLLLRISLSAIWLFHFIMLKISDSVKVSEVLSAFIKAKVYLFDLDPPLDFLKHVTSQMSQWHTAMLFCSYSVTKPSEFWLKCLIPEIQKNASRIFWLPGNWSQPDDSTCDITFHLWYHISPYQPMKTHQKIATPTC